MRKKRKKGWPRLDHSSTLTPKKLTVLTWKGTIFKRKWIIFQPNQFSGAGELFISGSLLTCFPPKKKDSEQKKLPREQSLGGGNSNMFLEFSPLNPGEMISQFWRTRIFFRGWNSTTNQITWDLKLYHLPGHPRRRSQDERRFCCRPFFPWFFGYRKTVDGSGIPKLHQLDHGRYPVSENTRFYTSKRWLGLGFRNHQPYVSCLWVKFVSMFLV